MAVTFTSTVSSVAGVGVAGARRNLDLDRGLKIAHIQMTSSDVSVDYVTGFDIAGNAAKFGFIKVWSVLGARVRASGGTFRAYFGHYDYTAGKLRFFETAGGAAGGAADDVDPDQDIIDGDVVDMIVIGN